MLLADELARRNLVVRDGHLFLDHVDLEEVADHFGTPLYVYSESRLLENVVQVEKIFRSRGICADIFYPSRACSNLAILEVIGRTRIGVEVDSTGELIKALTAGVAPNRILLTGTGKSEEFLKFAIEQGVRTISTDSLSEVELISSTARRLRQPVDLLVEVDPGLSFPHHRPPTPYCLKSGLDRYDALQLLEKILRLNHIRFRGIHVQAGAFQWSSATLHQAGEVALEILSSLESYMGVAADSIFFGGELPAPFEHVDLLSADEVTGNVDTDLLMADSLANLLRQFSRPLRILLSPGKRVVGNAGLLLTTVRRVKTKPVRDAEGNVTDLIRWLIVDAGFNILTQSAEHSGGHITLSVTRADRQHDIPFKIGGPLYDHRDYFRFGIQGSEYYLLPSDTRPGDRLAFLDTGAYSLDYMSEANSSPRAGAVMIRVSGQVQMIRHPDTYRKLIECDVFPGKYKKKPPISG
ncbi:MAG: hypothetical protein IRY98_02180 [Alicyclobacillaceae bacterium]|nr:hypothetical protein [Alicyclobacillaceae bacterium]